MRSSPITEITVRDVPIKVFESALPSMRFVWEMAAGFGDRDYVVYEDERYTYAEADAIIRSLAHHLRDVHGVGAGDRVAIAMRNYPEWVFSYWAIVSLGAACVGMNAWWTTDEMEYGLADSSPKVVIADGERVERILPVLDELRADRTAPPDHGALRRRAARRCVALGRRGRPADGARPACPTPTIDPDDDACIFYTSGTTGFPKGAQLTHRGSVHNLMHIIFMTGAAGLAAAKAGAAARAAGARRRRQPAPERVHGADAAVPRHRQQLPPAPGHASPGRASCSPTSGTPAGRSN